MVVHDDTNGREVKGGIGGGGWGDGGVGEWTQALEEIDVRF